MEDIKVYLQEKEIARDLLFIVDGFEKIGSLEDRKKILIDNSNRFVEIKTNMIITLPIELFSQVTKLNEFAKHITFPLITLDEESKERFEEFILKRIDKNLFEDGVIDKIISFGGGSPRETLKIISNAYVEAEEEIIDSQSIKDAVALMADEITRYLNEDEIDILSRIYKKELVDYSDTLAELLVKKVVVEYDSSEIREINPILLGKSSFVDRLVIKE